MPKASPDPSPPRAPVWLLGLSGASALLTSGFFLTVAEIRRSVERQDITGGAAFAINVPLLGLGLLALVVGVVPAVLWLDYLKSPGRRRGHAIGSAVLLLPWLYLALAAALFVVRAVIGSLT